MMDRYNVFVIDKMRKGDLFKKKKNEKPLFHAKDHCSITISTFWIGIKELWWSITYPIEK